MNAVGVRPRKGWRVKAFHPHYLGVVKEGECVGVGIKYARIDFGQLGGGVFRVPFRHVLEEVEKA